MSFEGRLTLQGSRATYIEALAKDSKKDHYKGLDVCVLQSHLDMLENYWAKFEDQHEKLVAGKDPAILEHEYVKSKVYDACLACYATARSQLISLIRRKDETADILSQSFRRNAPSTPHQATIRTLPKITLPNFSGKYSAWRSFKDLFKSMVTNNSDISSVEKMHYLKTSLTGEAAQLISNLPLSEDAFESAWALLTSRFENERLLIASQLDKIFCSTPIQSRCAKELNNLITSTTEAQNALKALNCPTDQWDMILVHHIAKRLDSKTREAWEIKIGSTTRFPTYEELKEFITGRARALECIEMHHGPKPQQSKNQETSRGSNSTRQPQQQASKGSENPSNVLVGNTTGSAHSVPTTSWADMSRLPCAMCSNDHFVLSCSQFRQLDPVARKRVVVQKRLCFNCFGKHPVSECRTTGRCQTCDRKHHTMIHIDGEDPPAPLTPAQRKAAGAAKAAASAAANAAKSSAQQPTNTSQAPQTQET